MSPLTREFFSTVSTALLHDPRLVESMDAKLTIGMKAVYKGPTINFMQIFLHVRSVRAPNP